ncbi:MAG: ABC transporter ATP-binding protein [Coriobacteriia bacterium]|nr:ABC transporter ATP-binding protein [Coriobacteriia bacterium]
MAESKAKTNTKAGTGRVTPIKIALYTLLALALIITPLIFEGYGWLFVPHIMALIGLYVMLALGLNIVVGFAGLLDLGYVAFYAIGAYAGVIVGAWAFKGAPALGPYIYFLMIPVAAAAAALTGLALGTPVLRLRGDYLAIVTLGFGEIVRIVITNNAFGITNGAAGLPAAGQFIPKPFGLDWLINNVYFNIPALGKNFIFTIDGNVYWYYMIVLLCLLTIFVVRRLDQSRLGRSWAAMREDEVAASSVGVSITAAKLWAFSLGALWGGIAGLTFANFQQFVSPESFTFMESVFIVCTIVIGGMGSIPGAIVGAIIIQGIPAFIQGMAAAGKIPGVDPSTATVIANYRFLVFGLFVVIMMAWRPQGLIPSKRRAAELKPDTAEMGDEESETLYDAQHDSGQF